jgi:hypothetical protein
VLHVVRVSLSAPPPMGVGVVGLPRCCGVQSVIGMEPEARLSSRECVNHPYFDGLMEEYGVAADFDTPPSTSSSASGHGAPMGSGAVMTSRGEYDEIYKQNQDFPVLYYMCGTADLLLVSVSLVCNLQDMKTCCCSSSMLVC